MTAASPWTPDRDGWAKLLSTEPPYRVDQVWQGLYQHGIPPSEQTNLPKVLRGRLAEEVSPSLDIATTQTTPDGKTVKWLFDLGNDQAIETVLMHYDDRSTVCVSSQAGCAMRCGFCATGQAGYQRSLTVGEILEQVLAAKSSAEPRRLSNIVFMGMGEPFANYDRVLTAVRRIINDVGIGARHLTISTIGLVPQIRRFADEGLQVGLAVSLHAANDAKRSELIPINNQHPLDELVEACRFYRDRTGRRVTFEWAMIDGVNDEPSDAEELAAVATAARAHVNLIPLNPTPGYPTRGSSADRIRLFRQDLANRRVNVTVRANRGTDIDAACGQLRANHQATAVTLRTGAPTDTT